MLIRR